MLALTTAVGCGAILIDGWDEMFPPRLERQARKVARGWDAYEKASQKLEAMLDTDRENAEQRLGFAQGVLDSVRLRQSQGLGKPTRY